MKPDIDIILEVEVLKAYLLHSRSHRYIQKHILGLPAPARGGGFEAMKILHRYNLHKEQKGMLKGASEEEFLTWFSGVNPDSGAEQDITHGIRARKKIQQGDFHYDDAQTTEREVTIRQRVYQNVLREKVLGNYGNRCAICGLDKEDLLICSHIVPWAHDSSNRLNPRNAVCLCALHDKLLDKGYFSFDKHCHFVYSDKADTTIKALLEPFTFSPPTQEAPDPAFLEYHRREICGITSD